MSDENDEVKREAMSRVEKLEQVVVWQRRERSRLEMLLVANGIDIPPTGGPDLAEVERAMCSSPDAVRAGAPMIEKWQHDHEARAVRAVQDFERAWHTTELEARLAAAANQELKLDLYRSKRAVDGGGVAGDATLPPRDWKAVQHYYADRAIARAEADQLQAGRLLDGVDAHVEAVRRWGPHAHVAETEVSRAVGVSEPNGTPVWLGTAPTWEEAFAMAEAALKHAKPV